MLADVGRLARLDLAFSRDEPRRYVQDTLREESAEIKRLRRENAELKRANAILKAASAFFVAIPSGEVR